jgi:hypothetical protein
MNRRNAVTLTEVLIAIFVLSIGLLALLSLFPLGAAQMAQALKDQRSAESAGIAGSQGRMLWKEACNLTPNGLKQDFYETSAPPSAVPGNPPPYKPASYQRFAYAMDDPNLNNFYQTSAGQIPYALPPSVMSVPAPREPKKMYVNPFYVDMVRIPDALPAGVAEQSQSSYPVFVDPIGWVANTATPARQLWVGHPLNASPMKQPPSNATGLIPRRPLYVKNPDPSTAAINPYIALGTGVLSSRQRVLNRFGLLDDINFDTNGLPFKPTPTSPIQREGRYTWAFLFRRQNNNGVNRSTVEMTVVVYSGRSIDVGSPEEQYMATGLGRQLVVNLKDPQNSSPVQKPKPAVRRGSWILDATIFNNNGLPQPQGYFYRVTNVDDSDPTLLKFDLQQELRTPVLTSRVIVVMENVVEVFPKGIVTSTSPPGDPAS